MDHALRGFFQGAPPRGTRCGSAPATLAVVVADWKKLLDDAVGQLGEAAQAAGQGLWQVAGEAGKVVGIGVGSIEVRTARSTHRLGETIRGVVSLRLQEPVEASALTVVLRATRRTRVRGGGQGAAVEDEVIHEFSVALGGEQVYESGEHEFALELPRELEARAEVGGLLGDAVRAARAFKSMTEGRLRWRLVVTLVIPWKRNLSKAFDVNVLEELGEPEVEPPPRAKAAPKTEGAASRTEPAPSKTEPAAPKAEPVPPTAEPAPSPIPLPHGWTLALSQALCALQGQGWTVIHHWAGAPVRPEVVREVLGRFPDLDPEILLFYGVMDGLELVVGKPREPRGSYESVRLAREVAARQGGSLGSLDEIQMSSGLGTPLEAEFESRGPDALRMLEIPTLDRLLDDSEDFTHRDGRNVIFGAVVLGYGDYLGITRADEIRRWREPAAGAVGREGHYDHCARAYQARLREREREHPGQAWWVVHGEDHGAALREPAVLLRWSEMLAACLRWLERGR